MARRQFGDDDECFYCGVHGGPVEHDHFPVPQCYGGTITVPVCRGCHDLKDRTPLDDWNPAMAFGAFIGLWEKADRDERLALAKIITLSVHALYAGQSF